MDVLSSQANIAGYRAVLVAAELFPRFFPMFMTAAGSIPPAKVLILGAGVAGLQAIATARRLGAYSGAFTSWSGDKFFGVAYCGSVAKKPNPPQPSLIREGAFGSSPDCAKTACRASVWQRTPCGCKGRLGGVRGFIFARLHPCWRRRLRTMLHCFRHTLCRNTEHQCEIKFTSHICRQNCCRAGLCGT